MKMTVVVATMASRPEIPDPTRTMIDAMTTDAELFWIRNTPEHNLGVIGSYQLALEELSKVDEPPDILAYIHDDVSVYEIGWDGRVMKEFWDPEVGVVGFGGAAIHGSTALYKTAYQISQLGRGLYASNVNDAEVHGARFEGVRDVAVLDGFSLIVRRSLLDRCGGWPVDRYPPHHVYDYWMCAMAHRHGFRVRLVGVRCHHHGGGTAVSREYQEWAAKTKWGSDAEMHRQGHKLFYEDFGDVMPWDTRGGRRG